MLSNPRLLLTLRLLTGVIFITASLNKIFHPASFRAIIAEYRLLPEFLLSFAAVTLPWVEFFCGVMIIFNIWAQSNALILTGIMIGFVAGISNNLLRGIIHDCGCFDILGINEPIGIAVIIRDIVFILIALPILLYGENKFTAGKKKR